MICKKCGLDKPDKGRCPNCYKKYQEKYRKEHREQALTYSASHNKDYYQNNKETLIENQKEYAVINSESIAKYQKNYRKDHKTERDDYKSEYEKERRETDPAYKLRTNCSRMIRKAMMGSKSNSSILDYLPYTMDELKRHLEKQFDDKMTWNNYGSYWHIDHIVPQSSFAYSSMENQAFKDCWALSNLRPLEAMENIMKSNKRLFKGIE
jgi:hypothetical protein